MATISVDVDIDEFDDEDIIQEAIDRKLVAQILAANKEDATGPSALAVKAAQNLYCSLTTRQYARAQAEMRILLEALLPPAIVAAEAAMREGNYQQAICDLDKFFPTPKPVFYIKETPHVPPHTPERKALVSRAARLVHHHGAPYAAVAKHCQLPIGTVAYEVRRYRPANGLRPTRKHGKANADWLPEPQNFHK